MKTVCKYPIGVPGVPWGDFEKRQWLWSRRKNRFREYDMDIMSYNPNDEGMFHRVSYGILRAPFYLEEECELGKRDYLLCAIVPDTFYPPQHHCGGSIHGSAVKHFPPDRNPTNIERLESIAKPTILITGGVHGYETSGIKGALKFISSGLAKTYSKDFNIVIVPCVSPWGYEMNERWTADAIDPNRSFGAKTEANPTPIRTDESTQLLNFLNTLSITTDDGVRHRPKWLCHLDLHETTNSDVTEFRPAKAARDGLMEYDDHIPDGFYLFGHCPQDEENTHHDQPKQPQLQQQQQHLNFYNAILKRVEKVTHIADSESDGTLCGHTATSRGLLLLPGCTELGICAGGAVPEATYAVTTEVYPDSDRTTDEVCVQAQIESICAALDYLLTLEQPFYKC